MNTDPVAEWDDAAKDAWMEAREGPCSSPGAAFWIGET